MPMIGATGEHGAIYATDADVAEVWRPLSEDEALDANAKCRRASSILRNQPGLRTIDDRLAAHTLDPDLVNTLVAEWVASVMRNPDGFTQENEGGYGYSRFGVAASTGLLMSSIPDLTSLQPPSRLPFGTIRTTTTLGPCW